MGNYFKVSRFLRLISQTPRFRAIGRWGTVGVDLLMTELNLEPLEKAISQLKSGIEQSRTVSDNDLLRDGVIQRFEYTMDLSWKMIQRYLKHIVQVDESVLRTKKDLFREAARLRLITNVEAWFGYYESRNETSHIYNSQIAESVFAQAELFLPDAIRLLEELKHAG